MDEVKDDTNVPSRSAPGSGGQMNKLIHELFEAQVRTRRNAIAANCAEQRLSYNELNRKSNQLARYLRSQGLEVGEYVPIVMSRSLDLLVAQLAVLKAGGAFVPIDPALPSERKEFMIRDCGGRWIISDRPFQEALHIDQKHWVHAVGGASWDLLPTDNLCLPLSPLQSAYAMYTSGSTGAPKGVMVPHRAVPGLVVNTDYIRIETDDCVVHCNNPAFDGSTFEVWGALLNGARLLIVPHATLLEAGSFAEMLQREKATVILLTTALFNQYAVTAPQIFKEFRYVLFGGEAADPNAARTVMREGRPEHLLNAYGPTETTVIATSHEIESGAPESKTLPIGRSIGNARVYILNRYLQPVPAGVIGEICIGGEGVSNGYLGRAELTAERFVADQFGDDPNGRVYRSGDLGLWREGGTIEYLGRDDQQVKLRGLRIELGEIEGQLRLDRRVHQTVVVVREDIPGERYLTAYLTLMPTATAQNASLTREDIREQLKSSLPKYMVPDAIVFLPNMPLTANGKIDRHALPVPNVQRPYEPPEGETETGLAEIWQELLRVKRVGRRSSFIELGGHSLLAMKLLMAIAERFGVQISITSILEEATLFDVAVLIQGQLVDGDSLTSPQELDLD